MRRLLAVLLLAAAGTPVPVLAMEVGLRALYPRPRIMTVDEVLGTRPQPHLDVRKTYGGHERVVRVRTNALGLRGGPLDVPKLHGVRRVLALGDSFTFGDAVEADEAWPRRLETALNPAGAAMRVEVVNAGVSGWGTAHQLLFFTAGEAGPAPDLVVLGFSVVNDLLDNLCVDEATYRPRPHAPCFVRDGDELRLEPPVSAPRPIVRAGWLPESRALELLVAQAKRLTIWNPSVLALARDAGLPVRLPYLPATVASWYDPRFHDEGWALTRALLTELRARLDRRGIPLVVLVIPASIQAEPAAGGKRRILDLLGNDLPAARAFLDDPGRPQRLMREFCEERGLRCVDPLPALLARAEQGETTYYPLDQHWTPASHALAAELVAEELRRRGWTRPVWPVVPLAEPSPSSRPGCAGSAMAGSRGGDGRGGRGRRHHRGRSARTSGRSC